MRDNDHLLGYLAHYVSPQRAYYAGLLVTDIHGIPKEFRHSEAIKSKKAGRLGLNIQEANYVFHFDRGWNPVDEMQAEDRCWRFGQKRHVFVYRYIQVGTIEERIHHVLMRKRGQFDEYVDSMVDDTDNLAAAKWSLEELIELLRPSTT